MAEIAVLPLDAPTALVSSQGLRWMVALREQYRQLLSFAPDIDAATLWEDDAILSPAGLRSYRGYLRCLDADRVEGHSVFFWDTEESINVRFPEHWSTSLFRVYPGDDFPLNYEVHCPHRVASSHRIAHLAGDWLNFGYMDPEDREMTWEAQKAAGKIDAHSLCLVAPPTIETYGDRKN